MKHLKTTLLAAGTSALLMLSMTAHADSEREIEQELAVADGGQVRFKIIDGDVSFKTWNKDLVKIKGHLGKKSDAQKEIRWSSRARTATSASQTKKKMVTLSKKTMISQDA